MRNYRACHTTGTTASDKPVNFHKQTNSLFSWLQFMPLLTHTRVEFLYRIDLLRKFLGYSLLIISCLAWAALPLVPFLSMDTGQKAQWGGGLFVFAEITWWAAMPLLGKEIIELWQLWWPRIKIYVGDLFRR